MKFWKTVYYINYALSTDASSPIIYKISNKKRMHSSRCNSSQIPVPKQSLSLLLPQSIIYLKSLQK